MLSLFVPHALRPFPTLKRMKFLFRTAWRYIRVKTRWEETFPPWSTCPFPSTDRPHSLSLGKFLEIVTPPPLLFSLGLLQPLLLRLYFSTTCQSHPIFLKRMDGGHTIDCLWERETTASPGHKGQPGEQKVHATQGITNPHREHQKQTP